MKTITDCFGHEVRLTDERLQHILEHPEMREMSGEIERVLSQPQLVRRSRSDAAGYEKETNHDAVMERVDQQGHVIGFSIMGVSQFSKEKPLDTELVSA